MADKKVKG